MSNKFDLEEKIDLLYNFNYNKDFPNCYELEKINFKNIKLKDIKIPYKNSKISEELSTDIFNGKFKLIKYNKDNKELVVKRYSNHFPVTVFLRPYKKELDSLKLDNSNNNDSMYSYLMSNLVLNRLTNHILLPIVNLDVRYNKISDIVTNLASKNDYINDIYNNRISDLFSVRVKENFFKSMSLADYVKKNNCNLKPLLFQLIHTL